MALRTAWEEVVWKVSSEKELQRGSTALVSFVSRYLRGPFGICRAELHSCEPQNCVSFVNKVCGKARNI